MSCEMRSTITRYPLGTAIFTPPSFTSSAVTPGTFMELMRSTSAGGKVRSMPYRMPIFFTGDHLCNHCFGTLILSGVMRIFWFSHCINFSMEDESYYYHAYNVGT